MKVLLIDDDPDVLEVVSLTFEMRWPDSSVVSALDAFIVRVDASIDSKVHCGTVVRGPSSNVAIGFAWNTISLGSNPTSLKTNSKR